MKEEVKKTLISVLFISCLLPCLISLAVDILFGETPYIQEPLHEFFELTGSGIGIVVSFLLLLRIRHEEESRHFLIVAAALLSMGILDGVHAVVPWSRTPGYGWLRHFASLAGGIVFGLVWFKPPARIARHHVAFATTFVAAALMLALFILTMPDLLPATWRAGNYTYVVQLNYLLAGFGFVSAAIFFLRRHLLFNNREDVVLACHTLLFGTASFITIYSHMWCADWWTWHAFRLFAYSILFLTGYSLLVSLTRSLHETNELFSQFMKYSPIYAYIKDVTRDRSVMLKSSENFVKLVGVTSDEIIGKAMEEIFPQEFAAKITADDRAVVAGGKPLHINEVFAGREYLTIKFPIALKEKSLLAGFMIDVTDQKEAEKKIKASLLEKETLIKEIHHRVKNNLAVISGLLALQARHLKDKEALLALQESQSRVMLMAGIHEMLYGSAELSRIDFGKFVWDLSMRLRLAYSGVGGSAVEVYTDVGDIRMTVDKSIPCGLIVNELISNAIRHAFPGGQSGEIHVRMTAEGDRLVLTVRDNGIGFPAPVDFDNLETLGLELVYILTNQLEGVLEMQSDGGTVWTITFPGGDGSGSTEG